MKKKSSPTQPYFAQQWHNTNFHIHKTKGNSFEQASSYRRDRRVKDTSQRFEGAKVIVLTKILRPSPSTSTGVIEQENQGQRNTGDNMCQRSPLDVPTQRGHAVHERTRHNGVTLCDNIITLDSCQLMPSAKPFVT